ncbi:MAG: ABC transporter permease [Candidatus Binatia bacterium]|nr:ABC transporter permease [Candidatus Binatia bacterium]
MSRVFAIAVNTARESIRNKVLYSVMFFAALLIGIASAFGAVSLGDSIKFVKDFALTGLSLFGVAATVVLGVTMVHNELQRRTIYNVLSKPVSRGEFLLGKYLGLMATLLAMVTGMAFAVFVVLGALEGAPDWNLVPAILMMLAEIAILAAVAVFFSTVVVTPALAGLFTVAAFIAGRSASWLAHFRGDEFPAALRAVAAVLQRVLPQLDQLYVADRLIAGQTLPASLYAWAVAYALCYVAVLLAASLVLFRRREFV